MEELTSYERQMVTGMLEDEDRVRRLHAYMVLAEDAVLRADLDAALAMADGSLSIACSTCANELVAQVRMTRAAILWDLRRFDEASLGYADAAALYRELDDPDAEGLAYLPLAWVAFQSGLYEPLFDHMRRAVNVYRDPADERILGNLIRMAEESLAVEQLDLSLQCSELAVEIASGFRDEPMHWNARCLKIAALDRLGTTDEAVELGRALMEEGLAANSRDRTLGVAILLIQIQAERDSANEAIHLCERLLGQFGTRLLVEQQELLLPLRDGARRPA